MALNSHRSGTFHGVAPRRSAILSIRRMLFMPGRRSLAVVIVALVSLIAPTAATAAGQIVIFGAESGSHMTLSTSGGKLEVEGLMANQAPQGCRFTEGRHKAVCDLAGADRVELQMGNSGDFVEVASPLPVPLTAHLGGGSGQVHRQRRARHLLLRRAPAATAASAAPATTSA